MSIPNRPKGITSIMKRRDMTTTAKATSITSTATHGAGHSHNTYGNELFFVLGTKAIPYVTPSMLFVSDLNNSPGSYLEIRLDGAIPIYREILKLQPYALLRLNLGYNTNAYYGWNNFQFGLKAIWRINRAISIFGGINYSVAMTALRDIDQGNEV